MGHVREIRKFFEYLDQQSHPEAWTYMEDEIFLLQHQELKDDLGPNVGCHYEYLNENANTADHLIMGEHWLQL